MAKVAANVILIWPGAHAAIPSGFTRETTLDDRFPKAVADAVNPGTLGGNATHTHNATGNHSHNVSGTHTHQVTVGAVVSPPATKSSTDGLSAAHTHGTSTSSVSSGGNLNSVSAQYGSVSNNPPYHEVIFIKSGGTNGVPDGVIGLYDYILGALPANWDDCDGNNGTPNLHDKYLKGATTGGDAGGTGGSTTNSHSLIHTHTPDAHSHASHTSAGGQNLAIEQWGGNPQNAIPIGNWNHTHTVTLANAVDTLVATYPIVGTAETVEPAYKKLMAIMNNTGGEDLPKELIGIWLGTLATIPKGWILCDGVDGKTVDMRQKHLKIGTSGQAGNTGGSNTHSHASESHTHSSAGHVHTGSTSNHSGLTNASGPSGTGYGLTLGTSVHSVSVASATPSYSSASTTSDLSNNEPLYTEVAFIKYVGAGGSVALLAHHL